jgi:hypothetical protein
MALRREEKHLRKEANWEAKHGMYGAAAIHQAQANAIRQERMDHHHHHHHHHPPHHVPHHHPPHHGHHERAHLVGPPVVVGRPKTVVVRTGCCTIL